MTMELIPHFVLELGCHSDLRCTRRNDGVMMRSPWSRNDTGRKFSHRKIFLHHFR
jgi:hypothetical protein